MAEQFRVPSPLVTRDFARVCRKILFIQAAEREGKRGREKPAGNSNWLIPRGYTVQEHAKNIFLREVKALAIAVPLPFAVSYHGLSSAEFAPYRKTHPRKRDTKGEEKVCSLQF